MGETLRAGNPDDYRIDNPGGPRVRGWGEADEGPKGWIEDGSFNELVMKCSSCNRVFLKFPFHATFQRAINNSC